ncbi:hypothetical protein ATO6_04775 [Oceanicola sp. 22II-s10i]|uniref:hypothetical protein n=1 Tax=Oceanicola sp. 22II-s10i TaxID=1317116 RepID=UPI000B522F1C|nr:hypothetical protein [Oceanicola sp. 22II-s10i]OWU86169.1 hypothetical protein ATO6_04775 [Oceanicola sp. 22II-s10i]
MAHTDSRTDAPLSRFTQPARAARDSYLLQRYRRALLSHGTGPKGILMVADRDPDRDRAQALVFGQPDGA